MSLPASPTNLPPTWKDWNHSSIRINQPVEDIRSAVRPTFFIGATLFCCLFLQRFGIPFGEQTMNIVGPLGLLLAIAGAISGSLGLNVTRLRIYLMLLFCVVLGEMYSFVGLVFLNSVISIPSLIQFLAVSFFVVFEFSEPMDERVFFRIVMKFFLAIAICGIVQFFVQFIGISIFKFSDFLPASILAERNWNLQIAFGIGDLYKSNGFFLIEPSTTSQFMAVAIIIETLFFRRSLYIAFLALAFVLAFSGTGGIVFISFLCAAVVRLGGRGVAIVFLLLVVAAAVGTAVILIAPDMAEMAQGRLNEFSTPSTSGHLRFITPFWVINDVMDERPVTALLGMGAGISEHMTLPYDYNVNTPVKIILEYGFPALVLYVLLFSYGTRTPTQSVLVFPLLVLLFFTGAYLQFPPVVFMVSFLIGVARLRPSEEPVARLPAYR